MIEWLAGIIFGFVVHEAAHVAVANYHGNTMQWQGTELVCQHPCQNMKQIAIAGLAVQAISSEILLTRDHQTNFTKGWLAFNVGNTVGYTIMNETTPGGYGDLANFTRDEARTIETVFMVHSATVAHRMSWQFIPTRNGVAFQYRF